ncbi:MAG: ornithine carbamoyltransferase [Elusimicrobia bacterium]|nr:ornithine carbamoyltransferase [Elusimicrobiota bacterium]
MITNKWRGRDYLAETDYSKEEIETIIDVAYELKRQRAMGQPHNNLLPGKTLFLIFYNQSLRTRNSFEAGMTQLGGHAHFLDPNKIYTPAMEGHEVAYTTERVSDVARTLSRMGDAIAIRCYGDPVQWRYGGAHEMLREFARWADIPVLNMEDDIYHPFQGLADIMTVKEKCGGFKGVKYLMSWAYSPSIDKPRAVPQSGITYPTMLGCDVTLAHPPEMVMDPKIIQQCKDYAKASGGKFRVERNFKKALKGQHVVYAKAWCPTAIYKPPIGQDDKKKAQQIFDKYKSWIVNEENLALADKKAVYLHCLPCDRGYEVTDGVVDGPQSVVFDQAENRLHGQKAVMNLVMR